MKKLFSIATILSVLFFVACNNKADKQATEQDTLVTKTVYSWESFIDDSTGRLKMNRRDSIGPDSLTSNSVIDFLNKTNPNIQLQLLRQSNDTLYIKIPDAEHLTQRMGSTGPTMYFANAVYNLTEIPGVKFVNFDFAEGDHASPGTYNRESFKDE